MGIMGMAEVIPLLRLTQHGSTPVPRVPKNCIVLSCIAVYDKEPQDAGGAPDGLGCIFKKGYFIIS